MKARRRTKNTPEPTILSLRDKLQIWGAVALVIAAAAGCLALHNRQHQRVFAESLTRTLSRWKPLYNLDDTQVSRIREIEIAFHGDGNPLTKPTRNAQEKLAHHREIAALMSPEAGKKFLENQGQH